MTRRPSDLFTATHGFVNRRGMSCCAKIPRAIKRKRAIHRQRLNDPATIDRLFRRQVHGCRANYSCARQGARLPRLWQAIIAKERLGALPRA